MAPTRKRSARAPISTTGPSSATSTNDAARSGPRLRKRPARATRLVAAAPAPLEPLPDLPPEIVAIIVDFIFPECCTANAAPVDDSATLKCSCCTWGRRRLIAPLLRLNSCWFSVTARLAYKHLCRRVYAARATDTEPCALLEALESPRGAFYASCVRRLEFETGDDSERKALKILALYFPKMVNLDALFFGRFSDAARDVSLTGLLLRAARGLPIRTLVFEGCGNLPLAGVLAPCLKTLKSLETLSFPLNGVATENVDAALAQAIPSSVRDLTFAPNGSADNLTRILKRLDRLDTLILELPVWMPLKSYERLEQITGQLRRLQVGLVELSGSERGGPFDPPRDLISKITSTSLRLVRFNRFRFGEQATDLINLLSKNPSVELIIFDTCEFANDDLTLLCGAAAPQVKQLALHGCETLNVLPRALAKLQNLEVLSIAEDVLDGPVWEAIGNMDSLTALEILDSEFEVDHLKTALDKLTEKNLKELVLGPEAFFLKGALENAYGSLKVSITGSPTWDLDWFV